MDATQRRIAVLLICITNLLGVRLARGEQTTTSTSTSTGTSTTTTTTTAPPTVTRIDISALPSAVTNAIQTAQPGAVITAAYSVMSATINGYKVEATVAGIAYQFAVTSDGKILSSGAAAQQPVAVSSLPPAVVAAVNTAAPNTTITSAMQAITGTTTTYLIQAQGTAGTYGFVVAADGTILKSWQNTHQDIDPSALPAAVIAALNTAAPGATVQKAVQETAGTNVFYDVYASTATTKYGFQFDASGNILKTFLQTSVTVANLPQAVLDAINAIAPGITIDSAQVTTTGTQSEYHVFGQDQTSRYAFDVGGDGTMFHYQMYTQIAASDLPANIVSAVATASSGGTITQAVQLNQSGTLSYLVTATFNGQTTQVAVDANGVILNALHLTQDIPVGMLPQAVVAAINAAYSGATLNHACQVSDGSRTLYAVDISIGNKMLRVGVDASGTIIKALPVSTPSSSSAPQPLPPTALPQAVSDAVNTSVPQGTVVNALRLKSKKSSTGQVYRVETLTATQDYTVLVDGNGTIMARTAKMLKKK